MPAGSWFLELLLVVGALDNMSGVSSPPSFPSLTSVKFLSPICVHLCLKIFFLLPIGGYLANH